MSARKDNTGKARERLSPAPAANIEYRRALASLRREAAVEIDRLIAFLDRVAPDPDLEEVDPAEDCGNAEPSLGSLDRCMNQTQAYRITNGWSAGYVDCEVEHDGREPDEDREPSLAAPERHPSANGFYSNPGESQIGWAAGLLQLKR